jgi:cellulose synthase/poly-beta-1,6-N-acetylglucosamine synthase-like glycosyltransferase
MPSVSCIIPANRTTLLDEVVRSVANQSHRVDEIIVVLDSSALQWESDLPHVSALKNPRNVGKVASILRALFRARGDLILCVDGDTILSSDSVEQMLSSLAGDVEVVCSRIAPLDTTTWIERTRNDLYRKWHAFPRLINGACFLAHRETLEVYLPQLGTMVEDQELTWLLGPKRWTICQSSVVRTEEPRNLSGLYRQMVRWCYGSSDLRTKCAKGYRAALAFINFIILDCFLATIVALARGGGLLSLSPLAVPVMMFLIWAAGFAKGHYMKGSSLMRIVPYSMVESSAFMVASARLTLRIPPRW